MPTLANIQGSSLVPNTSGITNQLLQAFGTKQSRDKEAAATQKADAQAAQLQGLTDIVAGSTGASVKDKEAALVRLSAINAPMANSMRSTLERGDKLELAQIAQATEEGTALALQVQGEPTHAGKLKVLTTAAQTAAGKGENLDRFLELSNMSEPQLDLELQRMLIQGADIKTLAGDALAPAKPTVLSEGQILVGPEGKVIARGTPKRIKKTALLENLEAIGIDPRSPEGRDIVKKSLTKPGVSVNLSEGLDFKVPPGFMLLDKKDPAKGVTPIPGGPKDNEVAGNASKIQMLRTAQKSAIDIKDLVFDEDGSINRTNLVTAGLNAPFSDGRKLRQKMEFGIQAITRAETGAAMPPEEVENTRERFMPKVGDSAEMAELKLRMFDEFIGGTLKLIDPSGRFDTDRFDEALGTRGLQTVNDMSDEELFK